jgi:3-oxoacid CoA-transferase
VLVVQTHVDKYGKSKIKKECDLPITGEGLTLRKYNPDTSMDEIRKKTAAEFEVREDCTTW